jgi:hypothetical protein
MPSDEFDELYLQANRLSKILVSAYRDITGEDLDLEGIVRHYPLVALGLAAGAGALGGWWVARKFQPQLPPPRPRSQLDTALDSLRDIGAKFKAAGQGAPGDEATPWEYVERLLPGALEALRKTFPDANIGQGASPGKNWLDTVLEPELRAGLDNVVSNLSESKVGLYFRQRMRRLGKGKDTRLEDQEGPAPL